jgi:hypothetical protein
MSKTPALYWTISSSSKPKPKPKPQTLEARASSLSKDYQKLLGSFHALKGYTPPKHNNNNKG